MPDYQHNFTFSVKITIAYFVFLHYRHQIWDTTDINQAR